MNNLKNYSEYINESIFQKSDDIKNYLFSEE